MRLSRVTWGMCAVSVLLLAGLASLADGDPPAPADPAAAAKAAADQAARDAYAETLRLSHDVKTGEEGLALWQKYLAQYKNSVMAEAAGREMDVWKNRADLKLARFGPQWMAADEVARRNEQADKLLEEAGKVADVNDAVKLLEQAARAHPFRPEIPFKRFELLLNADRTAEAARALTSLIRYDSDNQAARNNLGVIAAGQKQWQIALAHLLKAGLGGKDVVLDNLDQVMAMADEANYPRASDAERQLQTIVAKIQRDGQHKGETRWGNSWIDEKEYAAHRKANEEVERQLASNRAKMRKLESMYNSARRDKAKVDKRIEDARRGTDGRNEVPKMYRDQQRKLERDLKAIEDAARKIKDDTDEQKKKLIVPPHAGKLVLLTVDGSELKSISASGGEKKADDLFDAKDDAPKKENAKQGARNRPANRNRTNNKARDGN